MAVEPHLVTQKSLTHSTCSKNICWIYEYTSDMSTDRVNNTISNNCIYYLKLDRGLPGGAVVENLPANAGNTGSIPGWGTKIPPAAQHGQKINKTVDM